MLVKIIKDCYQYLKIKTPSPCLSVERTFALACFIYLDYHVENIYNYESEDILSLFGEEDEEEFIDSLNHLICNTFTALKFENYSFFFKILEGIDQIRSINLNLILSSDHIYTKILISILFKF